MSQSSTSTITEKSDINEQKREASKELKWTYKEEHAVVGGETSDDDAKRASEPTGDSQSKGKAQNAGPNNRHDYVSESLSPRSPRRLFEQRNPRRRALSSARH